MEESNKQTLNQKVEEEKILKPFTNNLPTLLSNNLAQKVSPPQVQNFNLKELQKLINPGMQKVKFSFLRYFNKQKKLSEPRDFRFEVDPDKRKILGVFMVWVDKLGIKHPKLEYPAYFWEDNGVEYPGVVATENIFPYEVILEVPGVSILTVQLAYYSELNPIFKGHPEVFSSLLSDIWEDNILATYLLYERAKGHKSFWKPLFDIWPEENDCLFNWDEDELLELQDYTLEKESEEDFNHMMNNWNDLHRCLSKHSDIFSPNTISLSSYKWAYIILTTRIFVSYIGTTAIVPFAECLNHENVQVSYDIILNTEDPFKDEKAEGEPINGEEGGYSSGIDSDRENSPSGEKGIVGCLPKTTRSAKPAVEEHIMLTLPEAECNIVESNEGEKNMNVEGGKELGEEEIKEVILESKIDMVNPFQEMEERFAKEPDPKTFKFVIKTRDQRFPKGSQVYLSYGNLSNRILLKRYGLALKKNKYDFSYIKVKVDSRDHIQMKKKLISEYFSLPKSIDESSILERHFKLYYQMFNTKLISFMKIATCRPQDIKNAVFETRSVRAEMVGLSKALLILERLFTQFPTTKKQDKIILLTAMEDLPSRKYFAILYRMEMKRIVSHQIKLGKIILLILQRLLSGRMDLEMACSRVFELEKKTDVAINRLMVSKYLSNLKKGLDANKAMKHKIAQFEENNPLEVERLVHEMNQRAQESSSEDESEEGSSEDSNSIENSEESDDQKPKSLRVEQIDEPNLDKIIDNQIEKDLRKEEEEEAKEQEFITNEENKIINEETNIHDINQPESIINNAEV